MVARINRWLSLALLLLLLLPQTADASALRRVFITDAQSTGRTAAVSEDALHVLMQDQHTRALDLYFVMALGAPSTLGIQAVVDEYTFTLFSVVGFVDGSYIGVVDGSGGFFFATQLGAPSGNVITVDSPIDDNYVMGSTVLNLTRDMTVNGSITPQVFQIGPIGTSIQIDITRIMGVMLGASTMDDGEFGDLPALARGCVLRVTNGDKVNLWNVKTNGELALLGFDFQYVDKLPAGVLGSARFRITYGGQNKHGVTIRLEESDTLELIIQDNLTGMTGFNMMAQGHVTN